MPMVLEAQDDEEAKPLRPSAISTCNALTASPWTRTKLAAASGLLLVWTAVLCLGAQLLGINFGQPSAEMITPRRPNGLTSTSRLLLGTDGDDVERRWTDKLLSDLQNSAHNEAVAATVSELRSTLSAREQRLQQQTPTVPPHTVDAGKRGSSATVPPPSATAAAVEVPRYDRSSIAELQRAAQAAAMPSEVRGPMPQLVRDLSAALARQQQEQERLQKRISQLQPAVPNYNPKEADQLLKAAAEATAGQGAEVSSALQKLLKDLTVQLTVKQDEQAKATKQLELEAVKKLRSARRAANLKSLLLKTSPRAADRVELLFDELKDRCAQAVDDAKQGYEDAEAGEVLTESAAKEEAARWQDSLEELKTLVNGEFTAAAERNATLGASYEEERNKRLALEERLLILTTPPPPPPPLAEGGLASQGGVSGQPAATTAVAGADPLSGQPASIAAPTVPTAPSGVAETGQGLAGLATAPTTTASAPPPMSTLFTSSAADHTGGSAPPPPGGACAGKRCPAGYVMIDRGDRCSCRPTS